MTLKDNQAQFQSEQRQDLLRSGMDASLHQPLESTSAALPTTSSITHSRQHPFPSDDEEDDCPFEGIINVRQRRFPSDDDNNCPFESITNSRKYPFPSEDEEDDCPFEGIANFRQRRFPSDDEDKCPFESTTNFRQHPFPSQDDFPFESTGAALPNANSRQHRSPGEDEWLQQRLSLRAFGTVHPPPGCPIPQGNNLIELEYH